MQTDQTPPSITFPVGRPDAGDPATAGPTRAPGADPVPATPSTWLPPLDLTAARAEVSAALAEAIGRDAVDEAHGDVVDRILADLADGWAQQTHAAYLTRLRELDEPYRDLLARRARLIDETRVLGDQVARLVAVHDAAWAELVGDDLRAAAAPVPATTVAGALAEPAPRTTGRPGPAPVPVRRPRPDTAH